MLKAFIIDDETQARNVIATLLKKYCPMVELVGESGNISEAFSLIKLCQPEVLLLDINMPGGSGFDLLDKTRDCKFHVIFTTAYDQYTLKAIKYSASDYLLKPIDPIEIRAAMQKIAEIIGKEQKDKHAHLEMLKSTLVRQADAMIAIPDSKGIRFIRIEEILSLNSNNTYTIISLQGKEEIVSTRSIKDYEELLSKNGFFRIHNTCMVNLRHLSRYIKGDGGFVVLSDNTQHEVSRRKKSDFLKIFSEWMKR